MFRVLCHCIDFIDFHSANLGMCALGRGGCQNPAIAGTGWGTILRRRGLDPPPPNRRTTSQAPRSLRKLRGRKGTGPQSPGLQSRPSLSPVPCSAPRVRVCPPQAPTVNTIPVKKKKKSFKSQARAVGLSPARLAQEAPTPAPSLAETLPVQSPAAPAAAQVTEKWKGGLGSEKDREHRPTQPDARTRGLLSGPVLGPWQNQLREPKLSQEEWAEGGARGTGLGREGRARRHFRWGWGCGLPRRSRPSAARARLLQARLRPHRLGAGSQATAPLIAPPTPEASG